MGNYLYYKKLTMKVKKQASYKVYYYRICMFTITVKTVSKFMYKFSTYVITRLKGKPG